MTDSPASVPHLLSRPLQELPDPLPLRPLPLIPPARSVDVALTPPGSKSLTNRLLLLAALARGQSVLRGVPAEADDVRRMLHAIDQLGADVDRRGPHEIAIRGTEGRWRPRSSSPTLDLGNAGTAARFLAAASLLAPGPVTIDGNERMRRRPIGELCDLLEQLGAPTEYLRDERFPPVRITPPAESFGGRCIDIPTTASSQFVSGLLLAAPFARGGLTIRFVGEVTSRSYVEMTLSLLDRLGVAVRISEGLRVVRVGTAGDADAPGLPAFDVSVEPDASGATYFWAAGALVPRLRCAVEGLGAGSLQGDIGFARILARMGAEVNFAPDDAGPVSCAHAGALSPVLVDMRDMPDAAVTLAVVCAFAKGPSVLRGLSTLRVKECDRIAALQTELARIDVRIEPGVQGDDGAVTITPPTGGVDCSDAAPEVTFDTYDDHRMAMALALVGLRRPNVRIRDPACVAKTYPAYWHDLARLYEAVRPA